ncbi:class I SAM-dependent rRNA methyltransferase [Derxia lacustris]|uniref:class I SAM-dependent rRNA methyltransferase n=1 Tax=Derxia lacustris TaxID=764842 RepID=UPI000A17364B|nr:class I SAM-dependent rRNA methyltransferase [Derxia lacustris]
MTARLILKPGRDKALLHGHPWIFSGAIETEPQRTQPGATVQVESAGGKPLALASWSPSSQIRARVWSFDLSRPIDHAFFKRRVAEAIALRRALMPDFDRQGALRLLHGESDGLPGVICDWYRAELAPAAGGESWLVLQLTSAGAERWRDALVAALVDATGTPNVYERSDSDVRGLEGLAPRTGVIRAAAGVTGPSAGFSIEENGLRLGVDIVGGHKTGFYADQRVNRAKVGRMAAGKRVLNTFCYTGGFSVAALAGGAESVVSIDSSADALELARANVARNGLDAGRADWICDDAFQALRRLRAEERQFDLVILDPPKLAPSAAHVERAARAYKDINLNGLRLLAPGGLLFTYSCSGAISTELFQKIVAGAAADAPADAVIVERLGADADHPLRLAFPEGEYLKGLVLRKAG